MGVERCVRDFASLPFCGIRFRACVGLMDQNVVLLVAPLVGALGAQILAGGFSDCECAM